MFSQLGYGITCSEHFYVIRTQAFILYYKVTILRRYHQRLLLLPGQPARWPVLPYLKLVSWFTVKWNFVRLA